MPATAARYLTLTEVRQWLRRDTATNTATGNSLAIVIAGVERSVDDRAETRFVETEFADLPIENCYDDELDIPRCQSLTAVSVGGTILDQNDYQLLPRKLSIGLPIEGEGYGKLLRKQGDWSRGDILISGKFGWKTLPDDMRTGLLYQVEMEYNVREGIQQLSAFEGQFVMEDNKPWHKNLYYTLLRYIEGGVKLGAV